ncbi:hypothetical protein [Saccharopolyspora dendranthemae]|uniref:Uncharacterized protein n=1 Tax=Saccharopolyspora dendranthemae TaxID=1181886 RepID=A0A561U468_9PSEU|nr:hypothetical protein [Saccharopolyspora dendranthemae]TWF94143.1 hypothetical protein FHU35_14425 [Saccharopolyspora dendranthemae]
MLTAAGKMIDAEVHALQAMARALQTHADDLTTVKRRMQDARDVAVKGGLAIDGFKIQEPGPAPAEPAALPTDQPATPEQKDAHASGVAAQDAFQQKATAYAQASQIVKDARKHESDSQHILVTFIKDNSDAVKLSLTLTDITGGVLGATAVRTRKYKELAESEILKSERAAKLTTSQNLSMANRTKAAAIEITTDLRAKDYADAATATRTARVIERFPPKVQVAIRALDVKLVPGGVKAPTPWLGGATKFGKIIPGAGLVLTGIGVGYDINQGKDPTQAVSSAGASLVSGAAVGACIGGPVGAVVGGVVGVGVGFAVDQNWDAITSTGEKLQEINPKMTR